MPSEERLGMNERFELNKEEQKEVFRFLKHEVEWQALTNKELKVDPLYDRLAASLGQPDAASHYDYIREKMKDGSWD